MMNSLASGSYHYAIMNVKNFTITPIAVLCQQMPPKDIQGSFDV